MLGRINAVTAAPTNKINNVYELPSIERAVRYLHGSSCFSTKATWLKAILNGTFLSWPLINLKNVNKHFTESEETQKGHIRFLHKNTRSTSRTTKKKKTGVKTPHPADATRLHYAKNDFSLDGGSTNRISQPPEHTTISTPI